MSPVIFSQALSSIEILRYATRDMNLSLATFLALCLAYHAENPLAVTEEREGAERLSRGFMIEAQFANDPHIPPTLHRLAQNRPGQNPARKNNGAIRSRPRIDSRA